MGATPEDEIRAVKTLKSATQEVLNEYQGEPYHGFKAKMDEFAESIEKAEAKKKNFFDDPKWKEKHDEFDANKAYIRDPESHPEVKKGLTNIEEMHKSRQYQEGLREVERLQAQQKEFFAEEARYAQQKPWGDGSNILGLPSPSFAQMDAAIFALIGQHLADPKRSNVQDAGNVADMEW